MTHLDHREILPPCTAAPGLPEALMAQMSLFPVKQIVREVWWHISIKLKEKEERKPFNMWKLGLQSQIITGCLSHLRSLSSARALGCTAKNSFRRNSGSLSDSVVTWQFYSTSTLSVLHCIWLLHTPENPVLTAPPLQVFVILTSSSKVHILSQYYYNIWHSYDLFFGRHEGKASSK